MLALFRNRRISRIAEEAEAFVSETYTEPKAEIEVLPDIFDEDDSNVRVIIIKPTHHT